MSLIDSFSIVFVVIFPMLSSSSDVERDFYSYTVRDIQGKPIKLEQYRGTVSLVVNVASECGFTDSHYKALTRLQESLSEGNKFQVLAFPCNQFGGQESGSNLEILNFAKTNFQVNFPIFAKIEVLGDADPAFQNLIDQSGKAPHWNFWKYLVNPEGRVVHAWPPSYSVDVVFDDIWREVTKAGGDVKSKLGNRGVRLDAEL